jgi:hypothetical protein
MKKKKEMNKLDLLLREREKLMQDERQKPKQLELLRRRKLL